MKLYLAYIYRKDMIDVATIFFFFLLVASQIDTKDSVSCSSTSIILALSDEINITLMYLSFTELWITFKPCHHSVLTT